MYARITRPDGSISKICVTPDALKPDETIEQAVLRVAEEIAPGAKIDLVDDFSMQVVQSPDAQCAKIIADALQGKSGSMLREAVYLQSLIAQGQTLDDDQKTEVEMFAAINEWEAAMIDAREARIAGKDTAWPDPPTGLSDFLKGF